MLNDGLIKVTTATERLTLLQLAKTAKLHNIYNKLSGNNNMLK